MQPIIGTLLRVARPDMPEGVTPPIDWLALYAQDEAGYQNLCELVSRAHLDRPIEEDAHVPFADLEGRTDGLIALTAGGEGALARLFAEEQEGAAMAYADRLEALFADRLYIEIARRGDAVEGKAEPNADRPRLCARPAARRDQPGLLRRAAISTTRTTRCCASPIRPMSRATIARAPRPRPG